jgi:acyl dehydratase
MQIVKKDDIADIIGKESGVSDWIEVAQPRINEFADVTEDHQFIHVNEDMAKMTPFGGTIAHGFLTLSLLSKMAEGGSIMMEGVKMGVNYGFDKVRFINPVPSGSKVRGRFVVKSIEEKRPGQFLVTYTVTVEIEGVEKPALIADWLGMQFTG